MANQKFQNEGDGGTNEPTGVSAPVSAGRNMQGSGDMNTAGSTTARNETLAEKYTGKPAPTDPSRSSSGNPTGGGSAGTGAAPARSLYDQAKETAGHAYEAAADKAATTLDEKKSTLSDGLSTVADSVRKVSENLRGPDVQNGICKYTAEYSEAAAKKIEGVANYLEHKSVREMYGDVENFARRNPAVFIGGAFALGLLLSRFLKSGAPSSQGSDANAEASRELHSMPSGGISTASEHNSGQGVQDIAGMSMAPASPTA